MGARAVTFLKEERKGIEDKEYNEKVEARLIENKCDCYT